MKKCLKCGKEYHDNFTICPICEVYFDGSSQDVSTTIDDIVVAGYQKPFIWAVRIFLGIGITSFFGWYYVNFLLTSTTQTLPFTKRLIAMMDIVHPGSMGESFIPIYLFFIIPPQYSGRKAVR